MNLNTTSIQGRSLLIKSTAATRSNLTWFERALFAIGIFEIPLGIDAFLFYSVSDAELGAVGGFNISITTICLGMLYAFWVLALMHRQLSYRPALFGIPMLVYVSAVLLSALAAEKPMLTLCDVFLLLQSYALFFFIANRITNRRDLTFCLGCLAAALATQGVIMIGQKCIGGALYGQRIFVGPISLSVWEDGRTAGTLVSAVLAGSWIAILWVITLSLFLTAKDTKLWWYLLCCLVLGLLGMLFTQTRGALISVVFGTLVVGVGMLVRGWLPSWTFGLALFGILTAVIPIAQIVQNRIVKGDEGSADSRTHLSAIAFKTIEQNPIFGYGAGNCHLACMEVANSSEFRSEWYFTIHCKYLLVWIETGILGLLAFLAVLLNGLRYGLVAWVQSRPKLSPLGLGCAAAIVGHMIHMIVDIFNSRAEVQTLWVVIGVSASIYRLSLVPIADPLARRVPV